MKVAFGKTEQPGIRITFVKHSEIVFHFITEKIWKIYRSIALFRLRRCDQMLSLKRLKGFVNEKLFLLQVKIFPGQKLWYERLEEYRKILGEAPGQSESAKKDYDLWRYRYPMDNAEKTSKQIRCIFRTERSPFTVDLTTCLGETDHPSRKNRPLVT